MPRWGKKFTQALRHSFSKENLKALFTQRSFKAGGYTALSCVVVIVLAALLVTVVDSLPASYTTYDISADQTTSISEETQELLDELEEDLTIYYICEEGSEDSLVELLLGQYASADHVELITRDPVLYPTFTSQYTSDTLDDNSLIITYGEDYQVVSYSSFYTLNSSTYSYEFAGESAITSAIASLVSEDLPLVYILVGHGEEVSSTVTSSLESVNMESAELNLLSEGSVPEDADAVLIVSPTSDLSEAEAEALEEYLAEGGRLMLLTDYNTGCGTGEMPNLDNLLNSYGVEGVEGVVLDETYSLNGYPYYLLPTIGEHDATGSLSEENTYVIMPLAHAIEEIDQYRSTLEITSLLTTSSSSYIKTNVDEAQTLSQEEGDIEGEATIGVAISEEVDDTETRIVWFSTSLLLDSSLDSMVNGNNTQLFINSLAWLTDSDTALISIDSKSTGSSYLVIDTASASLISLFVVGVVPLAILAVGFVIWRSRRAR